MINSLKSSRPQNKHGHPRGSWLLPRWYNIGLIPLLTTQGAVTDIRLGELAGLAQETMESYEVELGGRAIPGTIPTILYPRRTIADHRLRP